jgi:5-methylcytosine-specific restriction endonuclease McrA
MTWENWGVYTWHIDHIIPLSSAKTDEEVYLLWHYSNLRPLSAQENLKKGKKF